MSLLLKKNGRAVRFISPARPLAQTSMAELTHLILA